VLSVGSRWIGPSGPGCELASPTPVVARLKAPLAGSAAFSGAAPHRLAALWVTRGAVTDHGIAIDENTLYPLLRRLETQGLLVSEWREEDSRNKRFYRLSKDGHAILERLRDEMNSLHSSVRRILKEA